MADPGGWHYGGDLCRAAEVGTGTLYPAMGRMVADGWVVEERRREHGRPLRAYRLTELGVRAVRNLAQLGDDRHDISG